MLTFALVTTVTRAVMLVLTQKATQKATLKLQQSPGLSK